MRRFVLGSCLAVAFVSAGCGTESTLDLATPTPEETATPTPTATPNPCDVPGTVCVYGAMAAGDGDGGPALQGALSVAYDVARDGDGNLYIAETYAHRIRKIDTAGVITTLAGVDRYEWPVQTGLPSELTPANSPTMVAASPDGWVFWAGWDEPVIYGRDPDTGFTVIVAGDGTWDAGADGPALAVPAYLGWEAGMSTDADGNLYLADLDDHVVRVLNRQPTQITVASVDIAPGFVGTIAGNGNAGSCGNGVGATTCGLNNPSDVLPHVDGSVIIADMQNHRIRRVTPNGLINTIAGTGSAGSGGDGDLAITATFNHPQGIAGDATGRLFVVDDSLRVRLVNYTSGTTIWGGVSIAQNNVDTVAGTGAWSYYIEDDGGPGEDAAFSWDHGHPILDLNGDLVVPDAWSATVRKLSATTGTISVIAGLAGRADAAGYEPWVDWPSFLPTGELVYSAGTPYLYAVASNGERVRLAGDGATSLTGDGGPAIDASVFPDSVITVGSTILFTDTWNLHIRQIDAAGTVTTIAGTGAYVNGGSGDGGLATNAAFDACESIAADASGNLFVLDDDQIRFVNRGTANVTIAGVLVAPGEIERIAGISGSPGFSGDGGPALLAEMDTDSQTHMLVAAGALFFGDFRNHRIRRIDLTTGTITTFAGTGVEGYRGDGDLPKNAWVGWPGGLAARGGYLYWAQEYGAAIRRAPLDGAGPVETVVGNGLSGYAASGVPARETSFLWPAGITFAPDGALIFADGSKRLFRVAP